MGITRTQFAEEYFTKWVEAKAISNITSATIKKIFKQNIVCRFGACQVSVDNRKQLDCDEFKQFCHNIGTDIHFASVYHPHSNGAVERVNGLIFEGVKKKLLDQRKGKWAEEVPKIIWSHNTMESRTTKFIPFKLMYEEEARTLEEIKFESS